MLKAGRRSLRSLWTVDLLMPNLWAALRTVADILEGKDLDAIEYTAVRGIEGVKEATVNVGGKEIKLAVAHGTGNAKILSHIFSQSIDIIGCVAVHRRNRILHAADLLRFQHIFRIHFP